MMFFSQGCGWIGDDLKHSNVLGKTLALSSMFQPETIMSPLCENRNMKYYDGVVGS